MKVAGSGNAGQLSELGRQDSLDLLRQSAFGRIILSIDALPAALPANLAVEPGSVVFATEDEAVLRAGRSGAVVAVQSDGVDPFDLTGWSVLVTGETSEVVDPVELERYRRLPLHPWASGHAEHFIRVRATLVAGRRTALGCAACDQVAGSAFG